MNEVSGEVFAFVSNVLSEETLNEVGFISASAALFLLFFLIKLFAFIFSSTATTTSDGNQSTISSAESALGESKKPICTQLKVRN